MKIGADHREPDNVGGQDVAFGMQAVQEPQSGQRHVSGVAQVMIFDMTLPESSGAPRKDTVGIGM